MDGFISAISGEVPAHMYLILANFSAKLSKWLGIETSAAGEMGTLIASVILILLVVYLVYDVYKISFAGKKK